MTHKMMATTYAEQLAKHKEAVASLYRLCARGIPKEAEFWAYLADRKDEQASIMRQLKDYLRDGAISMVKDCFRFREIEESIEYVENLRRLMGAKGLVMSDALEVAWTVETTTVEAKSFSVFDEDAPGVREALADVHAQENDLRATIERRRTEIRKGGLEKWIGRMLSFMEKGEGGGG